MDFETLYRNMAKRAQLDRRPEKRTFQIEARPDTRGRTIRGSRLKKQLGRILKGG